MRHLIALLALSASFAAAAAVQAQDWPRFHFGVAVGNPYWSVDLANAGVPIPDPVLAGDTSPGPDTGAKLVAGFRPLRVVGVELQLVDFGDLDVDVYGARYVDLGKSGYWQQESHVNASFQATVLSALLFIPEALPRFDVYGKVGVADLDESISATAIDRRFGIGCPPPGTDLSGLGFGPCGFASDIDENDVRPYLGIGARFKVAREAAIRVEYETIDRDVGDNTSMLSVGIAWEW